MHKPSKIEADAAGVGQKKFLSGWKEKFDLNYQAVCNVKGRIIDMLITYGGSSLDCLACEASDLHKQLENRLLAVGLVIFGDNASTNDNAKGIAYWLDYCYC